MSNTRGKYLFCTLVANEPYTNTYFFKGGFAVTVWL